MADVTLEQLRIFVAVAEKGTVTRAAEAVGLTQSAASASLAALEGRYGVRLFDRLGRGVRLSEAGALFLEEAEGVLRRAKQAETLLFDLAGLRRGSLVLHASQTIAAYWLPQRMARFAAAHPGVGLRLTVGNTSQVARAVARGEAEIGFIEGRVEDERILHVPVGGDRLRLVAAASDGGAAKMGLTARELEGLAWVMREEGSGTRSELEASLSAAGVDPRRLDVRLELPSNEAVLAAVASGGLVSAVSELASAPLEAAGAIKDLGFPFPARPFERLSLAGRQLSAPAEAFLALL